MCPRSFRIDWDKVPLVSLFHPIVSIEPRNAMAFAFLLDVIARFVR